MWVCPTFLIGCLIVAVMKMNIKIALGASALFYVLITVGCWCWDSQIGDDTESGIVMARQQSEMQALDDDNNGDDEEMPNLDHEGHKELDAIEEVEEETDELDIRFKAFHGPASFSSPL